MKKNLFFTLIILISLSGCEPKGPSQQEFDQLKKQNQELTEKIESLNLELEGYRNSPEKLFAQVNDLYSSKNLNELKVISEKLSKYHPESKEAIQTKEMVTKLDSEITKKKEQEEKERLAKIEKEKAERMKAVNKLKKKYDDVSGVTWYENPYFTHYTNRFLTSIYIGKKDKDPWLRLRMSYYDEDWIFFEKAYLSYDGNTQEIHFDKFSDKETDNSGGYVWEWIDITVGDELLSFLQNMADGKTLKMRFVGKYTKTRNLSPNEVKGLKDVILAYDVLKSGE